MQSWRYEVWKLITCEGNADKQDGTPLLAAPETALSPPPVCADGKTDSPRLPVEMAQSFCTPHLEFMVRTSQGLCRPNISAAAALGLLLKEEARSIEADIKILSRAQTQQSASCLEEQRALEAARAQPDVTAARWGFDFSLLPRVTDLALRSDTASITWF